MLMRVCQALNAGEMLRLNPNRSPLLLPSLACLSEQSPLRQRQPRGAPSGAHAAGPGAWGPAAKVEGVGIEC